MLFWIVVIAVGLLTNADTKATLSFYMQTLIIYMLIDIMNKQKK